MSNQTIQTKFAEYLTINKELTKMRKGIKDLKTQSDSLDTEIKEYMTKNNMDSISLKEGDIVLYDKKVNMTFKKENMIETLRTELKGDVNKAESLVNKLVSNKIFNVQKSLKTKVKK